MMFLRGLNEMDECRLNRGRGREDKHELNGRNDHVVYFVKLMIQMQHFILDGGAPHFLACEM